MILGRVRIHDGLMVLVKSLPVSYSSISSKRISADIESSEPPR